MADVLGPPHHGVFSRKIVLDEWDHPASAADGHALDRDVLQLVEGDHAGQEATGAAGRLEGEDPAARADGPGQSRGERPGRSTHVHSHVAGESRWHIQRRCAVST